jgi:hypothetical protein
MANAMTPTTEIRRLFSLACHGDGADVRLSARADLVAAMNTDGWDSIGDYLRHYGLDIHVYFASRPITPPAPSLVSSRPSHPHPRRQPSLDHPTPTNPAPHSPEHVPKRLIPTASDIPQHQRPLSARSAVHDQDHVGDVPDRGGADAGCSDAWG